MNVPEFAKLDVSPPYEVIAAYLRRMIHLGVYPSGTRMPPEREQSVRLGVSRVTLRGAIRVLEGEGIVETRRGSTGGVFVLARTESREQLRDELRRRRPELEGILDFRLVNECCAAERAAVRVDDDGLAVLEELAQAVIDAENVGAFRQADLSFHVTIAAIADCELLSRAIEDARAGLFVPVEILDLEVMRQHSASQHQKIIAALRRRDPKAARRAMTVHLTSTNEQLGDLIGN